MILRVQKSIPRHTIEHLNEDTLSEHVKFDIGKEMVKHLVESKSIEYEFDVNNDEFIIIATLNIQDKYGYKP